MQDGSNSATNSSYKLTDHSGHTIGGIILLVAVLFGFEWILGLAVKHFFPEWTSFTVDGEVFEVGWTPIALASSVLLLALLAFIDRFFRGKLMEALGKSLSFFFPSFSATLQRLVMWYDGPDAKRQEAINEYLAEHGYEARRHLDQKTPFSRWMVVDVVPHYENNVQALAYWGAAMLILLIGLRGLQFLDRSHVAPLLIGLEIEALFISLLGFLLFYKPEERKRDGWGTGIVQIDIDGIRKNINSLEESLKEVNKDLDGLKAKFK